MANKNMFKEEIDLVVLAYIYCCRQARLTHKGFTIGDVLFACEKILRQIERHCLKNKKFLKNLEQSA